MKPKIKPNYEMTFHRDETVSYWSVYRKAWDRTSAYELTCRHDYFSELSEIERAKVWRVVEIGREKALRAVFRQ